MTVLGTLSIRDWDEGVWRTLGGEKTSYAVDGDTREIYTVAVPGVRSGLTHLNDRVPLHFSTPEEVYQPFLLPCYVAKLNDMTPAWERHPVYQWVGRGPAKGARKVVLPDGTEGYDRYENQWRAEQFDMSYEVQVLARRYQEGLLMLQYALRHFKPPWFAFTVIDSLGDVREYDAGEVSVSNASELADIADRTAAWTITFQVRAEIDLDDTVEMPAVQRVDVTYERYRP